MRSCVTELKYISCNNPGEMKSSRSSQAAQVLLSGSPVTVVMKGCLLTPNLTPVECASGGQIWPYLLGGGHSPEAEQLTWEKKVAKRSAEGRMPGSAT